jgi:hypothetical protein
MSSIPLPFFLFFFLVKPELKQKEKVRKGKTRRQKNKREGNENF